MGRSSDRHWHALLVHNEAMAGAVGRFLDEVTPAVEALGDRFRTRRAERLAGDVALDALDLTLALIDSDGLHTDNELWAVITTFGPILPSQLGHATPAEVRKAGLASGRKGWIEETSVLFALLLDADEQNGTSHSWTYYERSMAVAHEVAATDVFVSHLELTALEALRSRMINAIKAHGIVRPDLAVAPVGPGAEAAMAVKELEAEAPARSLDDLYAELDGLIGLGAVKAEVKLVANFVRVQGMRKERGLPVAATSRHLVFTGNPGTGKTTVARLLAQIYRVLGAVTKGHLVETDRSGLVAGYVGQTAIRVKEVFESALGGVLLIDEAYALAQGGQGDFGAEAVNTLVKLMEDHRDEVAVIAAGYPEEMATLIDSNPGLRSRFPKTIHFPDYTEDELVAIFSSLCDKGAYLPDKTALASVRARFAAEPRGKGFGNGRLARNLFEAAVAHQASRVVALPGPTDVQLCALTGADVDAAA